MLITSRVGPAVAAPSAGPRCGQRAGCSPASPWQAADGAQPGTLAQSARLQVQTRSNTLAVAGAVLRVAAGWQLCTARGAGGLEPVRAAAMDGLPVGRRRGPPAPHALAGPAVRPASPSCPLPVQSLSGELGQPDDAGVLLVDFGGRTCRMMPQDGSRQQARNFTTTRGSPRNSAGRQNRTAAGWARRGVARSSTAARAACGGCPCKRRFGLKGHEVFFLDHAGHFQNQGNFH